MKSHAFISYSHKDRSALDQLLVFLRPLERDGRISLWEDSRIEPGENWEAEIQQRLAGSSVGILLVSPHFLASDYITTKELPYLLQRAQSEQLKLLWIPIRDSMYEESPLKTVQALIDPKRPLLSQTRSARDRLLKIASKEILKALEHPSLPISSSSLAVAWPVSDPNYVWPLADRTKEFKLFDKMITGQSKRRILLLRGLSNTGKTACISELATYTQHLKVINALLDFKGTPSFDELFEMLRLDLGPDILKRATNAAPSARFLQLISDLQEQRVPLVLFFDTYQQASAEAQHWLENLFLRRIDRAPGVITVIGGHTVPSHEAYNWHQWTEFRNLQPIKVEDWMDYVRRKWNRTDVKDEYVKALTLATEGVPGRISVLLETMMLELEQELGD